MGESKGDFEGFIAMRMAALSAIDGWLNLTDRVQIPPRISSVGRATDNDIVINCGPDHLGYLNASQEIFTSDGGAEQKFEISAGGFPQVLVGDVLLELHSDGGPAALRVRDAKLKQKVKIDRFPYDTHWKIEADWVFLKEKKSEIIGQRGGSDAEVAITHIAYFSLRGQDYSLVPTHWKDGKPMFVIRDGTSGHETYGASRFLIGELLEQGRLLLDFNRLINPPCAFTDFAICPLPPRQNILSIRIEAGEKVPEFGS